MINSNYYFYFCAVFTIFTNSASVIAYFDSYTDIAVDGIDFINYNDPKHPMRYCKSLVGNDAIWLGYYDDVIPSDICRRYISCRANDVADQEYGVYPLDGVRCQRRTQNQYNNFGYGCYEGSCVPIICLDTMCERSHDQIVKSQSQVSLEQSTPVPREDRSETLDRRNWYDYSSSDDSLQPESSSYVQPQSDDQLQNDGQAQSENQTQIIRFELDN